jgi:mannose-6-phosphate isomerase-like protein (cupin superfamily)
MNDIALKPRQKFTVSHLNEADFKTRGLRSYSAYRDLGVAAATNGLATAHVIRMIEPFREELSQRHHHNVEFQLVYVLKGWFKSEFEGHGVHTMKEGSCWIQPPGIRHTVLGWSDDCEVLEIILPAEHETVNDP